MKFDIIGDIHGQYEALERMLGELGWEKRETGWNNALDPERRLVFLGDLVDRGPSSLEVAELVAELVASGRALCLLGNHEFNLVEYRAGRKKAKPGNQKTIDAFDREKARAAKVWDFMATLPVAMELEDLRLVHAVWHSGCVEHLEPVLGEPLDAGAAAGMEGVRLHAPYRGPTDFRPGLHRADFHDPLHGDQQQGALEVLVKGLETPAENPHMADEGRYHDRDRVDWWTEAHWAKHDALQRDRRVVFGHYWSLPPVPGSPQVGLTPPTPAEREAMTPWFRDNPIPEAGRVPVPDTAGAAVCVDFGGVTKLGRQVCLGAYRYPEAEVVWVAVPK